MSCEAGCRACKSVGRSLRVAIRVEWGPEGCLALLSAFGNCFEQMGLAEMKMVVRMVVFELVETGRVVELIAVVVGDLQPVVGLLAASEAFSSDRHPQCSFASICLMLDRI